MQRYTGNTDDVKVLGFCVSVAHADDVIEYIVRGVPFYITRLKK